MRRIADSASACRLSAASNSNSQTYGHSNSDGRDECGGIQNDGHS